METAPDASSQDYESALLENANKAKAVRANQQQAQEQALESVFDKLSIKAGAAMTTTTTTTTSEEGEFSTFAARRSTMPDDFSTYEALKLYTVGLIAKIGTCPSLRTAHPDAYEFFHALFQRHPEAERKKSALIVEIYIVVFPKAARKSPQSLMPADYQICYRTSDGLDDSISWVKSMRREDYSVAKKLTSALRFSIEGQVRAYRQANLRERCQQCSTNRELTVDHINQFEGLAHDFLQLHPGHPTEFVDAPVTHQEIFRPEDAAYEALWKDYHQSNARLQILCLTCNQARPEWQHPSGVKADKRWKATWCFRVIMRGIRREASRLQGEQERRKAATW